MPSPPVYGRGAKLNAWSNVEVVIPLPFWHRSIQSVTLTGLYHAQTAATPQPDQPRVVATSLVPYRRGAKALGYIYEGRLRGLKQAA